ncbi:glycosyltransferase [Marinobacter nauticus]
MEYIHSTPAQAGGTSLCLADNGSTNRTASIALDLASQYSDVSFVTVDRSAVGLALRTRCQSSKAQFIRYMGLDLATDLGHLLKCVELLESGNADLGIGSRLLKDSVVRGGVFRRGIISRVFNLKMGAYFETTL